MLGIIDTVGGKLRVRATRWAVILGNKDEAAHLVSETSFSDAFRPTFVVGGLRDEAGVYDFTQIVTFGDKSMVADYMDHYYPEVDKAEAHCVPVVAEIRQVSEKEYIALRLKWELICDERDPSWTEAQKARFREIAGRAQRELAELNLDSLSVQERWERVYAVERSFHEQKSDFLRKQA